ncbi:hypothetical protein Desor_3820 [Desulfosporosinus orientis DSM 765]|uniref:Uncharacterized protein n=1 Tax=Desulfosporosinus orientis (strain ATCC 19365 / DSM 765 / NCIMB 8382 / VKM B-1628 / Singapore I) TaxID=768706 RepID=G7W9E2_DESOD|nr:hypothetical protein Desor_3820 [Desulfosporosinus orientis DSM 765]
MATSLLVSGSNHHLWPSLVDVEIRTGIALIPANPQYPIHRLMHLFFFNKRLTAQI